MSSTRWRCQNDDPLVVCIHGLSIRRHLLTSQTSGTGKEITLTTFVSLCDLVMTLTGDEELTLCCFFSRYISSRSTASSSTKNIFCSTSWLCCCLVHCYVLSIKKILSLSCYWRLRDDPLTKRCFNSEIHRDYVIDVASFTNETRTLFAERYPSDTTIQFTLFFSVTSVSAPWRSVGRPIADPWFLNCSLLLIRLLLSVHSCIFRTRHVLPESTKSDVVTMSSTTIPSSTKRQNNSQSRSDSSSFKCHNSSSSLSIHSVRDPTRTIACKRTPSMWTPVNQDVDDEEAVHESTWTDTTHLINRAFSTWTDCQCHCHFWRSEHHTPFCSIFQSASHRVSPRTLVAMQ